jgi:creatinine amidohydrolase/Fe(II)-dependent formamide hydrolase-like protein
MEDELKKLRKTRIDGHAGEEETSTMLAHRPGLVIRRLNGRPRSCYKIRRQGGRNDRSSEG